MTRRTPGFTLVEVLVWIVTLLIVASLVSSLIVSSVDSMRAARRDVEIQTARISALEHVGRDVRCASGILRSHGTARSDERTLVLAAGSSASVVYRFEDGVLYRDTLMEAPPRTVPVCRLERLRFQYEKEDPASSRWVEVTMPGSHGESVRRRFHLMNEGGT